MGLFGKSAQQKRINQLAAENAQLQLDKDGLDATAKKYKDLYSDEARKATHLTADIHQLERDIAALLPDAEAYRRGQASLKAANERRRRDALTRRGSGSVIGDNTGTLINAQSAPAASVGAL